MKKGSYISCSFHSVLYRHGNGRKVDLPDNLLVMNSWLLYNSFSSLTSLSDIWYYLSNKCCEVCNHLRHNLLTVPCPHLPTSLPGSLGFVLLKSCAFHFNHYSLFIWIDRPVLIWQSKQLVKHLSHFNTMTKARSSTKICHTQNIFFALLIKSLLGFLTLYV